MKLEIIKRDIADITVTDFEVLIVLELGISHGAVKKSITPIHIEHTAEIDSMAMLGDDYKNGDEIASAIAVAVAGVQQRADETIAALRGLSPL